MGACNFNPSLEPDDLNILNIAAESVDDTSDLELLFFIHCAFVGLRIHGIHGISEI